MRIHIKVLAMIKEKVVVSIGGSVLVPGEEDHVYIQELAMMLKEILPQVDVSVVCGGGKIARYYTENGKRLGGTDYQLDLLGIAVTRINASLLALAMNDQKNIPTTIDEAGRMVRSGSILVMGGTEPGHTTDAVAMMLAREIGARRVVNATSVDAVYSDDPRRNPDAKRLSRITIDDLKELVYDEHGAGKSSVFDPLGVRIASEDKIDITIVDGRDLSDLRNAILGNQIKGTFIDSQ